MSEATGEGVGGLLDLLRTDTSVTGVTLTGTPTGDVRITLDRTPAGGWRPIETAPRDGTEIIILCRWSQDCARAYWNEGLWMTYSGGHEESPTHWMPFEPPDNPTLSRVLGETQVSRPEGSDGA